MRVWLDATLALTAPRFVVRFGDRDVADWGRPAFFGALRLEFPSCDGGRICDHDR